MTVREMAKLIENEQTFVLIDSNSGAEICDEFEAVRKERFERCLECEVIGLRTHSNSEVAFYIDAPVREFETWLDVTFSLRINLDVPYGADVHKVMEEYAKKKVDKLPTSITINGDQWDYGYSSMESGGFYDCIEEVVVTARK